MSLSNPNPRDLHAYFDGELNAHEQEELARMLQEDPQAQAELERLEWLHNALEREAQAKTELVSEARFNQVWDRIENEISRPLTQTSVAPQRSWWSRVSEVFSSWRLPATAGAFATVAVVLWIVRPTGFGMGNQSSGLTTPTLAAGSPQAASDSRVALAAPSAEGKVGLEPTLAPSYVFAEAKVERVDFGSQVGRVSTIEAGQGSTTVIWISEQNG